MEKIQQILNKGIDTYIEKHKVVRKKKKVIKFYITFNTYK